MRKLMWFTVGGTAACASAVYLLQELDLSALVAAGILLSTVTVILSLLWPRIKPVSAAVIGAAFFLAWMLVFQSVYLSPIRSIDGTTAPLDITLTQYSEKTQYGIAVEGYTRLEGKPYRIRAYVNEQLSLKPGDRVIGTFRVEDTTRGSDAHYQMGNSIFVVAYPKGEVYYRSAPQIPWFGYPAYLAANIRSLIQSIFPIDTVAFAQALLLGDTSLIDYETDTVLKLSGIRHVVAVSGLHVSILFSLVYAISGRRKWLALLLGLPTLLLFAATAGFTPSITRACIMHSLMMIAMLFEREYDPPTALSFALLLMLLANPYCISSVSLQLSVGCMCGIFLFSGKISTWLGDKSRLGRFSGRLARVCSWLSGSAAVSLSAAIVTTPLCAFYFGTVSLVSVLTNLLTLWVVTFIFYGILASAALAMIWLPLGTAAAWLVSLPMRYVLWMAKLLASFPLAAVYTASSYIVLFLIISYCLLAVFMRMRTKRPVALLCCMALSLCLALTASWTEPLTDSLRMTVLDVGQGQCILLQSGGKTFMVDCGGDSDTKSADIAAQKLLSMGISRLDGIILTHYDRDHAGGTAYLLTRLETDMLYLPDCADPDGYGAALQAHPNALLVQEHMTIRFADAAITLITTDLGGTNNESGLCVLFQGENCDILITGDRNMYGERDLLREIELPELEVLVVGHHGSKYSTSTDLLEAGRPEIAIISVGENSYGHPTAEVLNRLQEYGCEIYRTDQNGTIIFRR